MSQEKLAGKRYMILCLICFLFLGGLLPQNSFTFQPRKDQEPYQRYVETSKPYSLRGDRSMEVSVAQGGGVMHRVYLDAGPGITWVRIAAHHGFGGTMPEKWGNVFFDGTVNQGAEIIVPKFPPPCEGCGYEVVKGFNIYAWGSGTLTFRFQALMYWPEHLLPIEGRYIVDPKTDPIAGRAEIWHADASIAANPAIGQAGDPITITVKLPNRQRLHVANVNLRIWEPKAPGPTDYIDNWTTVTLPFSPSGVYTYIWTIPQEYFGRDNYFGGGATILFDAIANKSDRNGKFPTIESRATNIEIVGALKMDMGIQGKKVEFGERTEWDLRNPNTNPMYAWASGIYGKGPYTFTWNIGGKEYKTEPGNFPSVSTQAVEQSWRQSRYTDTAKLRETPTITVNIRDAIGNTVSGTIYVALPEPKLQKTKEIWIEPKDSTINKDQTLSLKAFATLVDNRKLEITGEVDFQPSRFFRSSTGGSFTIAGTSKTYAGTIQSATVTVRDKKRIALRIEPQIRKIIVGQTTDFDIVEVFEDNTQAKVGSKIFQATEAGTFTVGGEYKNDKTINISVVYVRALEKMWLEPKESTVNKGESVSFKVLAKFKDSYEEEITDNSTIKPAKLFRSDKGGNFVISASTTLYPGTIEPARVVVRAANKIGLRIEPQTVSIKQGETANFNVVEVYEDSTTKAVGKETFTGKSAGTFQVQGKFQNEATQNTATVIVSSQETVKTAEKPPQQPQLQPVKTPPAKPAPSKPTPVKPAKPGEIDNALADMLGDENTKDLCEKANARQMFASLNDLVANARTSYLRFIAYANKFDKEVGSRASDICKNSIVAYCFNSALEFGKNLDKVVPQILDLRNQIILLHGTCPSFVRDMQSQGQTINSTISATAGLGTYDDRMDRMRRFLNENGCDENELVQLAQTVPPPPGMDPDFLQAGGIMQELPGDAVDNDADGFQDEGLEALAGYNVTFLLYDSGQAKDDVFGLEVTKFGNLGTTPTGGLRSYGLNLTPGSYVATVTVIKAPDNVGTFTLVVLENGVRIASSSGGPSRGDRVSVPFVVKGKT